MSVRLYEAVWVFMTTGMRKSAVDSPLAVALNDAEVFSVFARIALGEETAGDTVCVTNWMLEDDAVKLGRLKKLRDEWLDKWERKLYDADKNPREAARRFALCIALQEWVHEERSRIVRNIMHNEAGVACLDEICIEQGELLRRSIDWLESHTGRKGIGVGGHTSRLFKSLGFQKSGTLAKRAEGAWSFPDYYRLPVMPEQEVRKLE